MRGGVKGGVPRASGLEVHGPSLSSPFILMLQGWQQFGWMQMVTLFEASTGRGLADHN